MMSKGWIVTISIIIVIVLTLGYFGLFPGVSTLLGANRPKDLGVKYTATDLKAGRDLAKIELKDQVGDKTLVFEGSKSISGDYSSAVMTAMINSAKYKYYPLTNTQILVHDDGSIETSGNINISKVGQWSLDLGASEGLVSKAKSYIGYISPNPSFYLKGKMSIVNNQISLNISEAKVSRYTAPESIINQYQGQLADFVQQRMASVSGMNIRFAKFDNGKMILDADYPAVEKSLK
jgi:hypothetical protein